MFGKGLFVGMCGLVVRVLVGMWAGRVGDCGSEDSRMTIKLGDCSMVV